MIVIKIGGGAGITRGVVRELRGGLRDAATSLPCWCMAGMPSSASSAAISAVHRAW